MLSCTAPSTFGPMKVALPRTYHQKTANTMTPPTRRIDQFLRLLAVLRARRNGSCASAYIVSAVGLCTAGKNRKMHVKTV